MPNYYNSYFDNFSSALGNPKGNLGDYAHASALYVRNNLRLAPKVKFLYHVVFDVNRNALLELGLYDQLKQTEFNLLVESASLPSYSFDTSTLNMYNRKKIVQTKVNYDPVEIVFHDDNAGLTTLLWEAYFRWYYQDPNYAYLDADGNPSTGVPSAYYNDTVKHYRSSGFQEYKHGLDRVRQNNSPFFNSITINQLHSANNDSHYTSIKLINPMITRFMHDRVDQTATDFMKNTMTLEYEAVSYGRGITGTDRPAGFADPAHYDVTPSSLTLQGSLNTSTTGWINLFNQIAKLSNLELYGFENIIAEQLAAEYGGQLGINSNNILFGVENNYVIGSIDTNFPGQATINENIPTQLIELQELQNSVLTRRERIDALNNNAQLLDDVSFRQTYIPEILNEGFSGNLNDMKTQWNLLSTTVKESYYQRTIDAQ